MYYYYDEIVSERRFFNRCMKFSIKLINGLNVNGLPSHILSHTDGGGLEAIRGSASCLRSLQHNHRENENRTSGILVTGRLL